MIEWPLFMMAGMLGSSHCLGMCGPFALVLGAASRSGWNNAWRQALYSAGRIFTYAFLGAIAGFGGEQLARRMPSFINAPALLAVVAGLYLIYQGLVAAGVLRHRWMAGKTCGAASLFRTLLTTSSGKDAFVAGLFTGLLPCGLLYGMLALAASTHHALAGSASMLIFGLGTVPAMVLAGSAGTVLSIAARRRVFAVAAWCLVIAGMVSVVRGASHLELFGRPAAGCPFCSAKT
jgi:sulfite exporter TauE/SafE